MNGDDNEVDHTLLESLFYNEMMLMEESPSLLLSVLTADGTPAVDANTLAETALLGEFGVVGRAPATTTASQWSTAPHPHPPPLHPSTVTAAPPVFSEWSTAATTPRPGETCSHGPPNNHVYHPASSSSSSSSSNNNNNSKLLSQFNTLASRLGIQLPLQLLPDVQEAPALTAATLPSQHFTLERALSSTDGSDGEDAPRSITGSEGFQPDVPDSATAATATGNTTATGGTRKRPASTSPATTAVTPTAASTAKRRKKPRLVECERKLAALQAENAILKKHLDNISSRQALQLQEQQAAERQLRVLYAQPTATDAELNAVLQSFTELYSDYGKRRQDELDFHLEQLELMVRPSAVTKMGLWTMGKSKNPIAGMLQAELGITPQQGRKILELRQKIVHVSSNLRECLTLLQKLRVLCEKKTKIFHDRLSKCREILTPRQVVRLIFWINDHSEVLERVCPGWGSEQIRN